MWRIITLLVVSLSFVGCERPTPAPDTGNEVDPTGPEKVVPWNVQVNDMKAHLTGRWVVVGNQIWKFAGDNELTLGVHRSVQKTNREMVITVNVLSYTPSEGNLGTVDSLSGQMDLYYEMIDGRWLIFDLKSVSLQVGKVRKLKE